MRLAVYDQESAGVRIISDGEQRRKTYLTYVTSKLGGFDYETLAEKWIRDGRRLAQVGRCTGPVQWSGPIVVEDLRFLQGLAAELTGFFPANPCKMRKTTLCVWRSTIRSRLAFA